MSDLNKVVLSGRLTADPELRQTSDGTTVCAFTIACNRLDKNKESVAEFINIVTWKHTAEFVARNFCKGKMIIIEGSLRKRKYQDKKYPEVSHYVTEVFANEVHFAGDKKETDAANVTEPDVNVDLSDFEEVIGDSDLPF